MSDIFVPSTAPLLSWPEVTASSIATLEGPDGSMTVAMDTCVSRLPGCRNLRRLEVCVWQRGRTWTQRRSVAPSLTRACYPGLIPLADASSLPALYRPARASPKAGMTRKHRPPQEKYFIGPVIPNTIA